MNRPGNLSVIAPFDAVVFDMDGTLLDTELVFKDIVYDVTRGLGFEMTEPVHLSHGRLEPRDHQPAAGRGLWGELSPTRCSTPSAAA